MWPKEARYRSLMEGHNILQTEKSSQNGALSWQWDGAKMQCAFLQRFSALGLFLFQRGEVVEQQAMNVDVTSAHFAQ